MTKFNIIHIFPLGNEGPSSYNEVISTVTWGLEQLGYFVSYEKYTYGSTLAELGKFNSVIKFDAINLILGAQILHIEFLRQLPYNSIIYNLEQRIGMLGVRDVPYEYLYQAEKFIIWDYSEHNISAWLKLYPMARVCHVKIGYAPVITKINLSVRQDIDVLIYGAPTPNRLEVFKSIASQGLKTVFFVGLYGDDRDELIAKSKVVLNLHHSGYDRIFEIVRVSYLLANSKAVISEISDETVLEAGISNFVLFSPVSDIPKLCKLLVSDETMRKNLEIIGRKGIESRDIRIILKDAWFIT